MRRGRYTPHVVSEDDDSSAANEHVALGTALDKVEGAPLVTAAPGPLPVLYQDAQLIIVNKPSGLSAHRGWDQDSPDFALTRVRDQVGQHVHLVHRLDRATSGAMAFVLDPAHIDPMQRAMHAGAMDKRYLALTRGKVAACGFLDYPVRKGSAKSKVRVEAQSAYWRRGLFEDRYALVEFKPLTGRLHQVRRHLRHLGTPILGDTTYGDNTANKLARERFKLMRLALHAWKLRLPHPVTGRPVEVLAEPGEDLTGLWRQMGLWPLPPA